jgi:hypothetical protein
MLFDPESLELTAAHHRAELAREAALERLAAEANAQPHDRRDQPAQPAPKQRLPRLARVFRVHARPA